MVETERMRLETGLHWGRKEAESWGGVEKCLRRLGRMCRGWDDMGEKQWGGRQGLGKQEFQGKMGFQETWGFQERMGK